MRRRIPEAAALRAFFQAHWDHLKVLLEARRAEKRHRQQEREVLDEAVEIVVDWTDARLRGVSGYQEELRQSTRGLLEHIEALAALIPAAVELSRDAYINDPMIHLLFHKPAQMQELVNRNQALQELCDSPRSRQTNEHFALLLVNLTEKSILGAEMRGEMMIKGVRQTSVSFSGHRLIAPCTTERQARSALKTVLFESVVEYLEHLNLRMRYNQTVDGERGTCIDPTVSIDNPEVYLRILKEQMSLPKKLIRLQDKILRVNSMGIKLPPESRVDAQPVKLHELEIGEEHCKILALVRLPCNLLQALPKVHQLC